MESRRIFQEILGLGVGTGNLDPSSSSTNRIEDAIYWATGPVSDQRYENSDWDQSLVWEDLYSQVDGTKDNRDPYLRYLYDHNLEFKRNSKGEFIILPIRSQICQYYNQLLRYELDKLERDALSTYTRADTEEGANRELKHLYSEYCMLFEDCCWRIDKLDKKSLTDVPGPEDDADLVSTIDQLHIYRLLRLYILGYISFILDILKVERLPLGYAQSDAFNRVVGFASPELYFTNVKIDLFFRRLEGIEMGEMPGANVVMKLLSEAYGLFYSLGVGPYLPADLEVTLDRLLNTIIALENSVLLISHDVPFPDNGIAVTYEIPFVKERLDDLIFDMGDRLSSTTNSLDWSRILDLEMERMRYISTDLKTSASIIEHSIARQWMDWLKVKRNEGYKESGFAGNDIKKISTNLSVPQLAYLFRILVDNEVITPENKSDLFRTVVFCFSTKKTLNVSAASFKNNFDSPESSASDFWKKKFKNFVSLI